ncbi:uncharacterized protein LOC106639487 [Copidosoma floridanum]|uniref:uncharacterized protein LOC106639487 n=1 Tax=Copidosoma floridanum TaxID=29053 RepID=UPI0006C9D51C|nr:uncharacterized protein LOC106639487 [Copidosoma floridanum]
MGLRTPSGPLQPVVIELWNNLPDLSDPTFGISGGVDILLGADVYPHLLWPGQLFRGDLVGQLTVAGWMLASHAPGPATSSSPAACMTAQDTSAPPWQEQLIALMQRFWELEDVPRVIRQSPDDIECEVIFANHHRAADGRYAVRLPLKRDGIERLRESLTGSTASLRSLQRRLRGAPEMAIEYARFMDEYLRCGHMRLLTDVELRESSGLVHYIPHHGIWQAGDHRKKLRVVFNASRPTSTGYSLNDILHAGPKLQACLPTVLLRWRRHRIAFCADIQMIFRQIWIDKRDVDLQRILWSTGNSSPPKHYQLLTVTYGKASAPYLSLRTISQLWEDEGHAWPEAVPIVKQDRCVDDILFGADDVETARLRRDQLIGLLQAGGFPLRKWVANDPELLRDLSPDARLRPTWRQLSADGFVSELGVSWDPIDDCFHLTPPTLQPRPTKRAMLAALARLFDPCGWIATAVLTTKMIIQDLWRARLEWDEPVPAAMAQRWSRFLTQLQNVPSIAIPRWISCSPATSLQLHAFADASQRAMAAVVYSRAENPADGVCVSILMSRTKLTPIKSLQPDATSPTRMTIPRLELQAALLAARLLRMVAEEYAVSVEHCHAWSDSQIVLHWLRSSEPTNN